MERRGFLKGAMKALGALVAAPIVAKAASVPRETLAERPAILDQTVPPPRTITINEIDAHEFAKRLKKPSDEMIRIMHDDGFPRPKGMNFAKALRPGGSHA